MPISKEAIGLLTDEELAAILPLGEFKKDRELLVRELQRRTELHPVIFLKVHGSSTCQLELNRLARESTSPYKVPDHRYSLTCTTHKTTCTVLRVPFSVGDLDELARLVRDYGSSLQPVKE